MYKKYLRKKLGGFSFFFSSTKMRLQEKENDFLSLSMTTFSAFFPLMLLTTRFKVEKLKGEDWGGREEKVIIHCHTQRINNKTFWLFHERMGEVQKQEKSVKHDKKNRD